MFDVILGRTEIPIAEDLNPEVLFDDWELVLAGTQNPCSGTATSSLRN